LRILVVTRVKTTRACKEDALAAQQGSPHSVGIWVLALLTCGIAIAGVAALWSGLQWRLGGNHSWMLPFVVLDAALLLRLSQFPAGPWRVIGITLVTAITTVLTAALSFSMVLLGALGVAPLLGLQQMSCGMLWLHWWPRLGSMDVGYAVLAVIALVWVERKTVFKH
jgi:hypothetical protein